jgi:hypothetical protein
MDERRSALLIATAKYGDDQLKRLRSPAHDARILCDVLADADIGAFDTTLLADRPSYEVRERIEGFFADRSPDELLLLYFSCHGVTDTDGRLYFATTDTRRQRFRATAVEAAFVQDCVHGCRSRRIVLILDCCHSGAFPAGMTPKGEHTAPIRAQLEGRGRAVLTSSDALEYAFEVDGDRVEGTGVGSAFTNALVEGLRSGRADLDGDGLISVDELYEYTYNRVRESQPSQTPRAWIDVQGQLVIARSVQPPSAEGLPVELRELIASPFANARLAAVSELASLLQHPRRGIAAAARAALVQLGGDDSRSVQEAARAALQPASDAAPAAGVMPAKALVDKPAVTRSGSGGLVADLIAEAGVVAGLVGFQQPWLYSGSGPSGSSLTTTVDFGSWTQVAAVLAIAAIVSAVLAGGAAILVAVRGRMSTVPSRLHRRLALTVLLTCVGAFASLLVIPPAGAGNFGDMAIPYWITLTGVAIAGATAAVQVTRRV